LEENGKEKVFHCNKIELSIKNPKHNTRPPALPNEQVLFLETNFW